MEITEENKITITIAYPDEKFEYKIDQDRAMELEILAVTNPTKRLMKTTLRVLDDILDKEENGELGLELILGTSRSGDIYNALKYLEYKEGIERRKEIKVIHILSKDKLLEVKQRIKQFLGN